MAGELTTESMDNWLNAYVERYKDSLDELPQFYFGAESSPCQKGQARDGFVGWKPVLREPQDDLNAIEQALETQFAADMHWYYGRYFCPPVKFSSEFGEGELLQCYNQEDFDFLQKNLVGHVLMKRKLKQQETLFIGVLDDGDWMITVKSDDGSVWLEQPGQEPEKQIATSIAELFETIRPRVAPASAPEIDDMPEHQGLFARFKRMARSLFGR
ncbi:SecY-interacting protein [Paraferrimonas sedimenticola]|uniref:Protein Syd n=1 Tax=Paraferrimonas sedimenticola TaxID=375674 RepID=A0AA37RX65_9GAMM|nr:SecY-interacting protein [Paraferrimonas sedimenticola]GLP96736.1 protein Syd [Paraferrimonas sedimenticola]